MCLRRRHGAQGLSAAWIFGGLEIGALGALVVVAARHAQAWSDYLRADALTAFFLLTTALVFGLVLLSIAAGIAYAFMMGRTRFGFELKASGEPPTAAASGGVTDPPNMKSCQTSIPCESHRS